MFSTRLSRFPPGPPVSPTFKNMYCGVNIQSIWFLPAAPWKSRSPHSQMQRTHFGRTFLRVHCTSYPSVARPWYKTIVPGVKTAHESTLTVDSTMNLTLQSYSTESLPRRETAVSVLVSAPVSAPRPGGPHIPPLLG